MIFPIQLFIIKMEEKTETKTCSKCSIVKPISDFYRKNAKCRECEKVERKERYQKKKELREQTKTRKCNVCKEEKLIPNFNPKSFACNECVAKKRKEKDLNKVKNSKEPNFRICNECGIKKNPSEYYSHHATCKECTREKQRQRNKDSREKEKILKSDPEYLIKTKICSSCGESKTMNNFRINQGSCGDCEKKRGFNCSSNSIKIYKSVENS
jgi:hypothetical protein